MIVIDENGELQIVQAGTPHQGFKVNKPSFVVSPS